MNLSSIILGTSNYGSRVSPSQAKKLIKIALSNDIKSFDTAPLYGFGLSEKIIGMATRNIVRNDIIINTKVGLRPTLKIKLIRILILPLLRRIIFKSPPTKKITTKAVIEDKILNSKEINKSINNSLKNLKTNYIDTLFIHTNYKKYLSEKCVNEKCVNVIGLFIHTNYKKYLSVEENVHTFQNLLESNKIKYLGITTSLTETNEIDWINDKTIINHIQIPFTKRHLIKKLKRKIKISYYSPFKGINNTQETYKQIHEWYIERKSDEQLIINLANNNTIDKHINNLQSL